MIVRFAFVFWIVVFAAGNGLAAERPGPLASVDWLKTRIAEGSNGLVILDIRAPHRGINPYLLGHIPGSVHAPYGGKWRKKVDGVVGMLPPVQEISAYISSLGIDNGDLVVIAPVGKSSSDFGAATRVYWTFKVLGHDDVTILDGGYEAWSRAGGGLGRNSVAPAAGDFEAEFRPELQATANQVAAALHSGTGIVDARPKEFFTGRLKSPVVKKAGTIPGASNLEQQTLYNPAKASFVDRQTIEKLASGAKIEAVEKTITFCNTGHWASIAWFALSEVAGRKDVSMYDGSMAEWTLDDERPVQ